MVLEKSCTAAMRWARPEVGRPELVADRLAFGPGSDNAFTTFHLHLLGAVTQPEKALIRERQREGIAVAKTRGVSGAGPAT